jgi:hypothetical protein
MIEIVAPAPNLYSGTTAVKDVTPTSGGIRTLI